MSHLPRDERDRVAKERSNTHELIVSRLRTLNQRLERKDQLLKDYEKDLEKLRLAEAIANEKATQVEGLAVSWIGYFCPGEGGTHNVKGKQGCATLHRVVFLQKHLKHGFHFEQNGKLLGKHMGTLFCLPITPKSG